MSVLQTLLETRVKHFLETRKRPSATEDVRAALRSLNDFYWEKVENIVKEYAPERNCILSLNEDLMTIMDLGLIHHDLLDDPQKKLQTLLASYEAGGGDKHIFYLSEWLQYRWHLDAVLADLEINRLSSQMAFQNESAAYKRQHGYRATSFGKLKHIIVTIPGMNSKIFDTMKSSRLFEFLEAAIFKKVTSGGEMAEEAMHMQQYFNKLLQQLKQRCLTKILKLAYDEFASAHTEICRMTVELAEDRRHKIKEVEEQKEQDVLSSKEHMTQNLRLLRSLINLGVAQSGTRRAFSVLFSTEHNSSKLQVQHFMELIKSVDPRIPGPPDVLLAPYAGEGFFEWDRDTLMVPITTEAPLEVSFAGTLAKYRILTDAMNFEGRMRLSWVKEFGREDFQSQFVEHYRSWVFGIGRGQGLAMENRKVFQWFVRNIGPNPAIGILPEAIQNMTKEEQLEEIKVCRSKLNVGQEDFTTIFHMGALNWRRENIPDAYKYMRQAHRLKLKHPLIHFSYAYISEIYNRSDAADLYYEIIRSYPETIWRVYAEIQLENPRLDRLKK
jgi:hypothetical protein